MIDVKLICFNRDLVGAWTFRERAEKTMEEDNVEEDNG
jgi:hypothetical protein